MARRTLAVRVLTLSVLVSTSLNGLQAYRIHRSNERLTQLQAAHQLSVGQTLPAVDSLDVNGNRTAVVTDEPRRPIIIYWMNPACVFCQRNELNLRSLVEAAADTYDVVAISSTFDGLKEFVEHTTPPYKVVGPPSPEALEAYNFGGTPMTIVLSSERTVMRVWRGAYEGSIKSEIESMFGVVLPGLMT